MDEPTLIPNIIANASGPQSMSADGVSVNSQQVTQQIEAEKFIQGSAALSRPGFGLLRQRFRPGSALGDVHR